MINDLKQAPLAPKFSFLLDELHRQGFLVGVGDMLKVHRYFTNLWEGPLSISDLKAQLAALVCQNPQQQKLFYEWFDKWAVVIQRRTEHLIAQLEPLEAPKDGPIVKPIDDSTKPIETPPPPPPVTSEKTGPTRDTFTPSPSLKQRKGPINIELSFPRNPIRFWNLSEFDSVLPVLREKKWVESTEWDIKASIKQTIQSGGIPKFVLKQKRQTPQYLMLIEQQSNRDHLAAFYADLAEELNSRDLNVSFYYYDITPAVCWRERNNTRTHVPLEQLQGEFADARLFIVGNAETLLKSTQLEPSAVAVSIWETWRETAVLSPRGTNDWGRAELAIGQLFPVIPANGRGLQSLTKQWQGTEHYTPTYWQINNPEPRTPNVSEFMVSERPKRENTEGSPLLPAWKTPTPDEGNQLNLLYFYLRDGGYRWLCATALYPEIYYELTRLYADEVIAKNQNLSEWEQNRLWGDALRLLLRLDWFRKGQIPTHWRGLLRDDFSVERALALNNPQFTQSVQEVRRQLLEVLKLPENTDGIPEDSYAAANQAFTQVWIESEMANNLADIPQKMTDLQISMSDIEDAVGQQLWFVEGQKLEQKTAAPLKRIRVFCAEESLAEAWKRLLSYEDNQRKLIDIQQVDSLQAANYVLNTEGSQFFIAAPNAPARPLVEMIGNNDFDRSTQLVFEQLDTINRWESIKLQRSEGELDRLLDYLTINLKYLDKTTNLMQLDKIICPIKTYETFKGEGNYGNDPVSIEIVNNHPTDTLYVAGAWLSELFGVDNAIINNRASAVPIEPNGKVNVYGDTFNFMFKDNVFPDKWDKFSNYFKVYVARNPFDISDYKQEDLDYPRQEATRKITPQKGIRDIKEAVVKAPWAIKTVEFELDVSAVTGVETTYTAPPVEKGPLSIKPKKGRLLFDVPKTMEVGKEYRCVVRIAHEDTPLFQNMEHTTNNAAQDINISDDMEVTLFNITDEARFRINGPSNSHQTIAKGSFTEWVFTVEPLLEHQQSLGLKITTIEEIEGKERRKEVILEEMIEVTRAVDVKKAVINAESARVYDQPNTDAKIVGTRVRGTDVSVIEEQGDWARIGDNMWVEIQCLGVKITGSINENIKAQISTLIMRARLDEALVVLENWVGTLGDNDLHNAVILQKSRYASLKKDENLALLSSSEANVERNRIASAILSVVENVEVGDKIIPFKDFSVSVKNPDIPVNNDRKTILFMGTNAPNTKQLQIEIEHSRIATELDGRYNLQVAKFMTASEISKLIVANKPNIIHFSGQGKKYPEADVVSKDSNLNGIVVFDSEMRQMKIVTNEQLEYLFKTIVNGFKIPIEVVLFSGCYSESQAKVLGKYIPYVVGSSSALKDEIAIAFAVGFYYGIANGQSIEDAFMQGKMQAVMEDASAETLIVLYRKGELLHEESYYGQKQAEAQQTTVSEPVKKEMAYLLIDLPVDMNVYHEVPCRVYIGYDKEILLQQQTTYGNNQIEEIEVSNSVRIALSDKTTKKATKKTESKAQQPNFEITEDSEKEQSISKTELTEWSFEIKPNREGEFELTFTIGSVNSQNEYKKVASFDKEIEVHGNNQYQSQTLA
jgi:hypothetical protein